MSKSNDRSKLTLLDTRFSLESSSPLLASPWTMTSTPAASVGTPADLADHNTCLSAHVPGTVLSTANTLSEYNALDWWYQCEFNAADNTPQQSRWHLQFDGLACLAEVWLNGESILKSQNMFLGHKVDIQDRLNTTSSNHLVIVFRSLQHALANKRPRPRWKTNLIDHQQLRWFRTTLLGHIPGWAYDAKAIGPWRPIYLVQCNQYDLTHFQLKTWHQQQQGHIKLEAQLTSFGAHNINNAILRINDHDHPVKLTQQQNKLSLTANISLNDVPLWWPHTHGEPTRLDYQLLLLDTAETLCIKSGKIGFKKIELLEGDSVAFLINEQKIFCRGACWSSNDLMTLAGDTQQLKESLLLAKNAGLNMLRIGGTMVYESDDFYNLCDELGILVWQDFMFANMDYPIDDLDFENNVTAEIHYQLQRLHTHPCISAYCGNSEVEQQAAMFGISEDIWKNRLFYQLLPDACAQWNVAIPYLPSSPCKGALPFHIGTGISHYFGIGAYKRLLNDASLSKVKFTSECLGFSNIPCEQTLQDCFANTAPAVHHPAWKAGVPRDNTSGWDFEDIRDFYLEALFKLNPIELRYADNPRYIALSQIITGELMQSAYHHWRSEQSVCNGALIWFYKDLKPGAGWGIIDSLNRPKPVYYYLKRAWTRQLITLNDEQLDGLSVTAINETADPLEALIELRLIKNNQVEIAQAQHPLSLNPYHSYTVSADQILGSFYDTNNAYRFGPVKHDIVIASLKSAQGHLISEAFYFPNGLNLPILKHINLDGHLDLDGEDLLLSLNSDQFLQSVQITAKHYSAEDNYFHLPPRHKKIVRLIKHHHSDSKTNERVKVTLKALNFADTLRIQL